MEVWKELAPHLDGLVGLHKSMICSLEAELTGAVARGAIFKALYTKAVILLQLLLVGGVGVGGQHPSPSSQACSGILEV